MEKKSVKNGVALALFGVEDLRRIPTKTIVYVAMFAALDLVLTRVFRMMGLPFNFGFVSISIASVMIGPIWVLITAFLSDLLGALLFPQGAYFPGYGLTAMLRALVLVLFFYNQSGLFMDLKQPWMEKAKPILRIVLACVCFQIINLATLPLWDGMLSGKLESYGLMFLRRLPGATIFLGVQVVTLVLIFHYIKPSMVKRL